MAGSNGSARILLIEDNYVDVDLLKLALDEEAGWSVETTIAQDGEQAMKLLQQHAGDPGRCPDFIILDLNLPRRDGAEVLQMIRTTQSLSAIPVAVLSSSPRDLVYDKLAEAGVRADGHFVKPMDLDAFLALGKTLRAWFEAECAKRIAL
jgi:CheY-like chemotaxis protein